MLFARVGSTCTRRCPSVARERGVSLEGTFTVSLFDAVTLPRILEGRVLSGRHSVEAEHPWLPGGQARLAARRQSRRVPREKQPWQEEAACPLGRAARPGSGSRAVTRSRGRREWTAPWAQPSALQPRSDFTWAGSRRYPARLARAGPNPGVFCPSTPTSPARPSSGLQGGEDPL